MTREREHAAPGKSTGAEPPGYQTYVDALVAIIPGEVLILHAVVMERWSKKADGSGGSVIEITGDDSTMRLAFVLLCAVSALLYWVGHRRTRAKGEAMSWDPLDAGRALVPPAAFVLWAMLQPTSVLDGAWPSLDADLRWVTALFGAVALGIVASSLAGKADAQTPGEPAIGETPSESGSTSTAAESLPTESGTLSPEPEVVPVGA
jgi:hypothetical protein